MNKFYLHTVSFLSKHRNGLLLFLLFWVCVFTAFAVRTYHYNTAVYELNAMIEDIPVKERDPEPGFFKKFLPYYHKNFSPFTIESAMMYSYSKDIALGKGVRKEDPALCGIEDIPPYAQMNMGLEWFLGWGWKIKNAIFPDSEASPRQELFQDYPYMAQWMSSQLRFWASLTSGFVFLWLIMLRCPKLPALYGGLLHAVSLAAVARSTGQDFVRGEFCIPLITATIVLAYSIYKKPAAWKYVLIFLTAFLAFVTWDLCQMLFGTWICFELLRFFLGRPMPAPRRNAWICIAAAILLNA